MLSNHRRLQTEFRYVFVVSEFRHIVNSVFFFLFYNTMKLVNVVSPDSVLFCSVNYPSLWTCGVWYSFSLGYQKKAA